MSAVAFDDSRMKAFKKVLAKYEKPASALLPTLYLAQEQFGYLSRPVMDYVGGLLDLPPAHVYEVVSFYSMFKKKDMGKFCLQVCNNITCSMVGSEELLTVIQEETGLGIGQVSEDGMFSCVAVQCLGSCDTGPVVQVNDDYFENQTPSTLRELIQRMKRGESPNTLKESR